MAALTNNIPTINSGSRNPIDPGPSRGGFLGGLADLASKGLQAYGSFADNSYQQEQRADLKEAGVARNAAEGSLFEAMKAASQPARSEELLSTPLQSVWGAVPKEVVNAGKELSNLQNAASQGRASTTAFDLNLERTVSDLYAKFPDQKDTIATYLQGRGIDHYLFREVQLGINQAEQQRTDEVARQTYYRTTATQKGLATPGMTDEQTMEAGRKWLENDAIIKQQTAELDLTIKRTDLNQKDRDFKLTEGRTTTTNALINQSTVRFGTIVQSMSSFSTAYPDDANFQTELSKIRPQIVAAVQSYRQATIARMTELNLPQANQDAVLKDLDDKVASIDTIFDANYKVNQQAVTNMENVFKLDNTKSFPIYSRLSRLLGQQTINTLFGGGAPPLDPKLVESLGKEFSGIGDFTDPDAAVHLNNAVRLLKGDSVLQDLTPEQARKQFPIQAAAVTGNGKAIAFGKTYTPENAQLFVNSLSNVANAAMELQPGTVGMTDLHTATGLNSSPTNAIAMEKLVKDPTTAGRAVPLLQATRNTAVQLFQTARDTGPTKDDNRYQTLDYNKETGRYEIKFDRAAFDANFKQRMKQWEASGHNGLRPLGAEYFVGQPLSTQLKSKRDVLNTNLDYYATTHKLDPNAPQGATPLSVRNNLVNGVPLTTATGKPVINPDEQIRTQLDGFRDQIRNLPNEIATSPATTLTRIEGQTGSLLSAAAEKYGLPESLVHSVAYHESRGNQGAVSPKGAIGVMQLMPETAKELGVDPNDLSGNIEGGVKYLKQLYDKYGGDIDKVVAAYNAGPGNVDRAGGIPNFPETQQYVQNVRGSAGL